MTRLHQRFFQLSVNRKARKRAEEQEDSTVQYSFKPQIGDKSKSMAEAKFKETLSSIGG
jgi:hypothetical protein